MRCQRDTERAVDSQQDVANSMDDIMAEFMDGVPIHLLDDKTLNNLYRNMKRTIQATQDNLDTFRRMNGIEINRPVMDPVKLGERISKEALGRGFDGALNKLKALGLDIRKSASLGNQNLLSDFRKVMEDVIDTTLPDPKLKDEWIKSGKTYESYMDILKRMPADDRTEALVVLQGEFPQGFQRLKEGFTDAPANVADVAKKMKVVEELETIESQMNGAIDLALTYARNPFDDASELSPEYMQITSDFRLTENGAAIKAQYNDSLIQKVARHQFGSMTESLATKMLKSQVPGAQMFAMVILESPAGYGGAFTRPATASIRSEILHLGSIYKVNKAYSDMLDQYAIDMNWGKYKRQMMQDGHSRTHKEIQDINIDIMLHINDLKLGRESHAKPQIQKFAMIQKAEYDRIHEMGIGKVSGITKKNQIKHYDQQVYNDPVLLALGKSPEDMDKLIDLFRIGMVNGGMEDDVAQFVSTALMQQKMNAMHRTSARYTTPFGEEDIPGGMPKLKDLVEQMRLNEVRDSDIKRFVDQFNEGLDAADALPGYAHNRLNIDLSASREVAGVKTRIIDLMEQDSPGKFDRYSKEANARIAIAEEMPLLNSDQAIEDYFFNVGKQAQLMGTSVDTKAMRNSLNIMMGRQPEGALPIDVRKIRDLVALAGMGGLGESQLAETGMAMARGVAAMVGFAQMRSGRKGAKNMLKGVELTPEQLGDKAFLDELAELTGIFQQSYRFDRYNVHFDQKDMDFGATSKVIDIATGGKHRNAMKAAQTRFTGYGAIRSMQEQVANASMIQDIARSYKGGKAFTSPARFKDLGVDIENMDNVFFRNFREHADWSPDGNIRSLNIQKWSPADRSEAGILLARHTGQVVQRGFVGEMSPLMDNPWVAFMMQFRSYPILAAEKQQGRHMKFADKEAATGIFLNTVSSAGARIVRYAALAAAVSSDRREEYFKNKMDDLGHDTFAYMGIAGMTSELSSWVHQAAGNPFGGGHYQRAEGLHTEVPVFNYINKVFDFHEGMTDGTDFDEYDIGRGMSLLPLGTTAFLGALGGVAKGDETEEW